MSKKKLKNKRAKSKKRSKSSSGETQRADSITVFWTTSVLATVLGQVGGLGARVVMYFMGEPYPPSLQLLSALLLMISCITGLVSMGLLPLVYRWRRVPPPWPVVRFAIVAAVLPFVIFLAVVVFGA